MKNGNGQKKVYIEIIIEVQRSLYFCVRGVMVIVVGNGHGDTSSNPGRD